MRLRARVGVFSPGRPRLQMDTIMSKEMISEESGERRDKKEERRRFLEKKAQDKDTEKAVLANGPSSQLTQSEINSRVLQGSMANHQA